jgi:hypothetical protein
MYWFLLRPKWIAFTLGIVLLIVVMINLGLWQLRRLDERRTFNAAVEAHYNMPPRPLDSVLNRHRSGGRPMGRHRCGTYRPGDRPHREPSQNGFAGDIVVPLDLATVARCSSTAACRSARMPGAVR